ncbi:MAG: hypothetical protein K2Q25_00305 [Mycobacteriaceae bacterium]|nr:hypothetical protein [Mycobacteriaceae bacterium]
MTALPSPPVGMHMTPPPPYRRKWGAAVVAWTALLLAVVGVGLGGAGLLHSIEASTSSSAKTTVTVMATPQSPSFSATDAEAAKSEACTAVKTSAQAISDARKPFLAAPPAWDDPTTAAALTHVQAVAAIELDYLRQHTTPATPASVSTAIGEYISAVTDALDADIRRESAAVSNNASERADRAYDSASKACGTG